ncbi:methionine synthase [Propionibacteriaceae bacterium Y1923]|uniref:methionine synthase n=1 Tax=Aestuariimicrobium sp. Y1814 TaxID=3418742 RepID=UPI003C222862
MILRAAGLGSLPGTDLPAALRMLSEATPEVVAVPELPARGAGADMVGRTAAMLSGLGVDLQPAGWRLTDSAGIDQRRARARLRRDFDELEEHLQGHAGIVKFALAGPWTMASLVERPRGDKVLADHGARRELAQSLAAGADDLLAELRRRLPEVTWWVQVDEPMLAPVLAGKVATASSFSKHRAVDAAQVAELLDLFSGLAEVSGLHWCGRPEVEVMARVGFSAVSVDTGSLVSSDLDTLAQWLEGGRQVWWGAVPTAVVDQLGSLDEAAARLYRLFEVLGLDSEVLLGGLVTPACGLGTWSPLPAQEVLRQAARVAEITTERVADGR